jgi:hypothetical protein
MDLIQLAIRLASRWAARTEVLLQIDQAFDKEGVYPPTMNRVGPDKYIGTIDKDWELEVTEKDSTLEIRLNEKPVKSLTDAAQIYKRNKNKATSQNKPVRIFPATGSVGSIRYKISQYDYDGASHERIEASWTNGKDNFLVDIESSGGQPKFHTFKVNNVDLAKTADAGDWHTIPEHLSTPHSMDMNEILQQLSQSFENAAHGHAPEIPEWEGAEGTFFQWLMKEKRQIKNGELLPKDKPELTN